MRTRSGMCYPKAVSTKKKADLAAGDCLKRTRLSPEIVAGGCDFFDVLPDDLVLLVLSKLNSTAGCPADFISVLMTCKRLNGLGLDPFVLYSAPLEIIIGNANSCPSECYHRFLKLCRSEYYCRFLELCAETGSPIALAYFFMVGVCMSEEAQWLGEKGKELLLAVIGMVAHRSRNGRRQGHRLISAYDTL